jgi:hypothetical protein
MTRLGLAAIAGLVLLVGFGCDVVNPRAPRDAKLAAATDSTVLISWAEPSEGTPEAYLVYFRGVSETLYSLVVETPATQFEHFPAGATGRYRIAARFGNSTYESDVEPSSAPVGTGLIAVAELNASGNSGYGWDRATGKGRTYSMRKSASRTAVDFYITDFKPAALPELPYSVASPSMGPADAGAVVPVDTWRSNRFTDPLADEQAALPSASIPVYYNYGDITSSPSFIGCFTADSHYALVKVLQVDSANGWARLQTWFQPVKGLRLINH